ncbi:hypothetical protein ACSBR1_037893 [Camellia fascicularis]
MECSPKSCGEAADNMEEEKSCHPIPPLHNANSEVTRSLREIPPAHFIFKIKSFSQLSQLLSDAEVQNYESDIFEASGYKWKLSFYPNGDKKRKVEGHISLYLVIAETNNLPLGWEVNVNFKLFVYDQIQDKYMTIQDANGKVRSFHAMKTEWGFAQLLPLSTFNDADNGYLICDTCVLGAEVSVIREVTRSLREIPPAHFIFKIESFSQLSQLLSNAEVQNYESDIFEASGYKWKLSFYPNGDKKRKGEGHISLYLVIAETSDLPLGWEVNVNFKLFVYDQIQDKYMTIQDANGKVRRFHGMKTEWGFAQLLPLSTFNDADNGYLICDACIFGAEVFVINYTGRGQSINILKEFDRTYTWKIDNFSSLDGEIHNSDVFTLGNRNWRLYLYPKGHSTAKDTCLSLFLGLHDLKTFPSERKTYAKYKMRIRSQYHCEHKETEGSKCFTSGSTSWGRPSFLSLTDLHDASKGFLVNDTLIVEAKVSIISTVKNFCVNMHEAFIPVIQGS